ncbi:MAG: cation:proton antiporter [Anaerolineae bacterium]
MNPALQFLLVLTIIIFAAKAAGYLSTRLGQAAVLGELLVGLALGPSLLDLLGWPVFSRGDLSHTIAYLAELGVIFLMFIAGLEIDLREMVRAGKVALSAGTMGVVVPVVMGVGIALLFGIAPQASLFIGVLLAATSTSISAQTLLELGMLRSREGLTLIGASVVADMLVIVAISLLIAFSADPAQSLSGMGIAWLVLRMIGFLALSVVLGTLFLPRLTERVANLPISQGLMAFVIVITLFLAWSAEHLGSLAAIIGAFLAGVLFRNAPLRAHIEEGMHTITYAFLVPIFFVNIGLETNARTLDGRDLLFVVAVCLVAILSKLLGSGGGARLAGFSNAQALWVGVGMISRGEVGLIIASVGLTSGLIGQRLFSVMIIMVLVTTVITPILLKGTFPGKERESEQPVGAGVG